ncbi:hypothetical protein [Yeosuana marina]|uniref:hypothetical protein n=1 Tax=Yeosuana marina TaxID=1565536 RepID=UPI001421108F|nr:hypothetical protein [Yeosuana marina]
MKVNQEQIEDLYTFTRKHFVEWYDVQTELVDHLANGIEEQWEQTPHLSFEEALKIEFKKFGVFGFSEIVEKKTNALEKYYRKEAWKLLKEYFKLPKIIATSFSIWMLFKILQLFNNKEYIVVFLMIGVACVYFFYILKELKRIKKINKQTGKKWLFENVIAQLGGLIHFLNIGIYMPLINFDRQWDTLALLSFSTCFVVYILLLFVSIKVVTPRLKEKLSKEHPEYKLL